MTEIEPFHALRFDTTAIGDLADVVAPPYDVISERGRDELEAQSPYNVVRLVLGRDEPDDDATSNKYTRARALLETWLAAGVLRRDSDPSLTLYEMRAEIHGTPVVTRGILAAVSLEDAERGGVLPHERVYDRIVADRLELMRATGANLDCIFCVYDGPDQAAADLLDQVAAGEPLARFRTPDGIEHVVWSISDPGAIETITRALDKAQAVIADGHHRWTTARRYRDERRRSEGPGAWDRQIMYLVDAGRHGPALLPIHRVIPNLEAEAALRALEGVCEIREVAGADADKLAELVAAQGRRTFGMMDASRAWLVRVADENAERDAMPAERSQAWKDLDVSVLHALIFDRLLGGVTPAFVHTPGEAAEAAGQDGLAFLLPPMPFDAVRDVAEAGDAMPQKSTYFVPKPGTGIVLRILE